MLNVRLAMHSTFPTGGTSSSATGIIHDPLNPLGTANFTQWTVAPADLGTLIGYVRMGKIWTPSVPTTIDRKDWTFGAPRPVRALVLATNSIQQLSIYLRAAAAPAGCQVSGDFEWTES